MIERLIAKGHAYAAEGNVLFAVQSMANYGELSGRSLDRNAGRCPSRGCQLQTICRRLCTLEALRSQ